MKVRIPGLQSLLGTVAAPGSKAYTHRALIASLLSSGRTVIHGPSKCDDARTTLAAIRTLGAEVTSQDDTFVAHGQGTASPEYNIDVQCGQSGTTLRLLTAVAATSTQRVRIHASSGLAQRPQAPLLRSLEELGASTSTKETEQGIELEVKGPLKGGETWIEGTVSSQFISGLLFAAPLARKNVTVHVTDRLESRPYVDMSIDILKKHGVEIEKEADTFHIPAPQKYVATSHNVPGDFSSAAFLIAGAGIAGGEVRITGVNNYRFEPDHVVLKLLDHIGATVSSDKTSVTVKKKVLRGFKFDARDNPDLVPALEVLGSFADGNTEIEGVGRLRFKETNRLETVSSELAKMGAKITIDKDTMRIAGTRNLRGAVLDSQGDHRVAMACSIAGVAAEGESELQNAEVVSKSYPDFFKDLSTLGVALHVE